MNNPSALNIHHIIDSLLNDRHNDTEPLIPDAVTDISNIVTGLRILSKEGRVIYSDENYSIGNMLGQLLSQYIPDNPSENDYTTALIGLTLLIARILRAIPAIAPDMSIEEFLIEPTDQHSLIELGKILTATPMITTQNGTLRPNIAQLPDFHTPIPITEEALLGFAKRNIIPYENIAIPIQGSLVSFTESPELPLNEDELIADPFNGFEDFFGHYWDNNEDE